MGSRRLVWISVELECLDQAYSAAPFVHGQHGKIASDAVTACRQASAPYHPLLQGRFEPD